MRVWLRITTWKGRGSLGTSPLGHAMPCNTHPTLLLGTLYYGPLGGCCVLHTMTWCCNGQELRVFMYMQLLDVYIFLNPGEIWPQDVTATPWWLGFSRREPTWESSQKVHRQKKEPFLWTWVYREPPVKSSSTSHPFKKVCGDEWWWSIGCTTWPQLRTHLSRKCENQGGRVECSFGADTTSALGRQEIHQRSHVSKTLVQIHFWRPLGMWECPCTIKKSKEIQEISGSKTRKLTLLEESECHSTPPSAGPRCSFGNPALEAHRSPDANTRMSPLQGHEASTCTGSSSHHAGDVKLTSLVRCNYTSAS